MVGLESHGESWCRGCTGVRGVMADPCRGGVCRADREVLTVLRGSGFAGSGANIDQRRDGGRAGPAGQRGELGQGGVPRNMPRW